MASTWQGCDGSPLDAWRTGEGESGFDLCGKWVVVNAMKCERCGKATSGYDLHDYCRSCSKNLCADCMGKGCCGKIPAESGMNDDVIEDNSNSGPAEQPCVPKFAASLEDPGADVGSVDATAPGSSLEAGT